MKSFSKINHIYPKGKILHRGLVLEMEQNIFLRAARESIQTNLAEMHKLALISQLHPNLESIKDYIRKKISTLREKRRQSQILKRRKNLKHAHSILMHNHLKEFLLKFHKEI
jgi:hypothetical protein